jgi:hypothetical protein
MLPLRLQRVWDEMSEFDDGETGYAKARALMRTKPKRARQQLLIYAVLSSGFNLTKALRRVGIPRKTLLDWMENDPGFTDLLHEVQEMKKDFFEEGLVGLVKRGDSPGIIFANRTQNRDRGYGEKTEIHHSGNIVQWTIPVNELNLPTDTLRTLLTALKEQKALVEKATKPVPQLVDATVLSAEFETEGASDGDNHKEKEEKGQVSPETRKRTTTSRQHQPSAPGAKHGSAAGKDLPAATVRHTKRLRTGKTRVKSV